MGAERASDGCRGSNRKQPFGCSLCNRSRGPVYVYVSACTAANGIFSRQPTRRKRRRSVGLQPPKSEAGAPLRIRTARSAPLAFGCASRAPPCRRITVHTWRASKFRCRCNSRSVKTVT